MDTAGCPILPLLVTLSNTTSDEDTIRLCSLQVFLLTVILTRTSTRDVHVFTDSCETVAVKVSLIWLTEWERSVINFNENVGLGIVTSYTTYKEVAVDSEVSALRIPFSYLKSQFYFI